MAQNGIPTCYQRRRQRFLKALGKGAAVIFTGSQLVKGRDTEIKFRPDSYFYYLTGFTEPEAIALFQPRQSKDKFTLFVQPRDAGSAVWIGDRAGQQGAVKSFGADTAFAHEEFDHRFSELVRHCEMLHYGMGVHAAFDQRICDIVSTYTPNLRSRERQLAAIASPFTVLDDMRLRKDTHELKIMTAAAKISIATFKEVMQQIKPGMHEYEVEAAMEYGFRRRGASGPAFPTIAAGGNNATILHYTKNQAPMRNGDLITIDAGCELDYYASDVTRTVPINGRFSREQKQIYELVLRAQKKAIAAVKPGVRLWDLHDLTRGVLCKGLLKLGILKGSYAQAIKSKEFAQFFPHNTSHWLGLDVHDVGVYFDEKGRSTPLEPGMVFSVEPGLYFPRANKNIPKAYRGIGVRIEDEVVVTPAGHRVLTDAIPKEVAEIETHMA